MKTFAGVLVGLGLLLIASQGWAFNYQVAECETEGLCHVAVNSLPGKTELWLDVAFPSACFPRIVNERLAQGVAPESWAPIGVWFSRSGLRHDGDEAMVSVRIRNDAKAIQRGLYYSFAWQCERMLP